MVDTTIEITDKHKEGIKKLLDLFGSQSEMAAYFGLSIQTINDWVHCRKPISLIHAVKICEQFKGIKLDDLRPDFSSHISHNQDDIDEEESE